MEDARSQRKILRTNSRHGAAHIFAVLLCTAVTLLFVILTYSRITLPHYTTKYAQKDTQQVVNLIITVVATVITILFSQCRRLTNEAETKCELRDEELTIPRLHVHVEAAGGSHAALGWPAVHNKQIWKLVSFYLFAIIVFGFINSVLSVIFVIELIVSEKGYQSPVAIPLGVDVPFEFEGKVVDPCAFSLQEPGCSYDLAITALSSQLVTYSQYTVAGITFEPPNGTMGLPYWALKHFTDQVQSSRFEEEYRSYCLPVLDPNIIHCTEEPFDEVSGQTNFSLQTGTRLVKYTTFEAAQWRDADMYKIEIPSNASVENIKYRTSDQGYGAMLVRMYPEILHNNVTIITGVDSVVPKMGVAYHDGYASLLYSLMYGVYPDDSIKPKNGPFHFVAKCEWDSIKWRDNYRSSWRKVDFTLRSGVSRANVTDELCENPRAPMSGFDDLYFDLEGASDVLSSTDGFCKLFNQNPDKGQGTDLFHGMSDLDSIVNKMLHITATAWSQENYGYAMQNQTVHDKPVIMTNYPHLYVIRINWTPATYIGLVLSILITLNAYALASRWARATYRLGLTGETWNLLQPVDLMAYSLAAYQDLIHNLNTKEHRRMAMRGETTSMLRDWPYSQGTQSLIGLVSTAKTAYSATNTSSTISPISGPGETPQEHGGVVARDSVEDRTDDGGASVSVEDREKDAAHERTEDAAPEIRDDAAHEQAEDATHHRRDDGAHERE